MSQKTTRRYDASPYVTATTTYLSEPQVGSPLFAGLNASGIPVGIFGEMYLGAIPYNGTDAITSVKLKFNGPSDMNYAYFTRVGNTTVATALEEVDFNHLASTGHIPQTGTSNQDGFSVVFNNVTAGQYLSFELIMSNMSVPTYLTPRSIELYSNNVLVNTVTSDYCRFMQVSPRHTEFAIDVNSICSDYNFDANVQLTLNYHTVINNQLTFQYVSMNNMSIVTTSPYTSLNISDATVDSSGIMHFALQECDYITSIDSHYYLQISDGTKTAILPGNFDTSDTNYGEDHSIDIYALSDTSYTKAIITIHGGSWSVESKDTQFNAQDVESDYFVSSGLLHVNMNYSLLGRSAKNVPNKLPYEVMLDDIRAVVDYVSCHYGINDIALMGYSAGAHLALLYAYSRCDSRITKVVSEAGPTYFIDKYGTPEVLDGNIRKLLSFDSNTTIDNLTYYQKQIMHNASPYYFASNNSVDTILLYGVQGTTPDMKKDGIIYLTQATELKNILDDRCTLYVLMGVAHPNILNYAHDNMNAVIIYTDIDDPNSLTPDTTFEQYFQAICSFSNPQSD